MVRLNQLYQLVRPKMSVLDFNYEQNALEQQATLSEDSVDRCADDYHMWMDRQEAVRIRASLFSNQ